LKDANVPGSPRPASGEEVTPSAEFDEHDHLVEAPLKAIETPEARNVGGDWTYEQGLTAPDKEAGAVRP